MYNIYHTFQTLGREGRENHRTYQYIYRKLEIIHVADLYLGQVRHIIEPSVMSQDP